VEVNLRSLMSPAIAEMEQSVYRCACLSDSMADRRSDDPQPTSERSMFERWDAQRVSSLALKVGCASQVIWVLLNDIISFLTSHGGYSVGYPEVVVHVIWLAPIPALWIVRGASSVTVLYALALSAILTSRLYDCLQVVMYGPSVLRRVTGADLAATAICWLSLVVILTWVAHLLTNLVFIAVQRIVGVFRNG